MKSDPLKELEEAMSAVLAEPAAGPNAEARQAEPSESSAASATGPKAAADEIERVGMLERVRAKSILAAFANARANKKREPRSGSIGSQMTLASAWQAMKAMIPAPLAVAALAIFIGHHGVAVYMRAQTVEVEAQFNAAKADAAKAAADAQNMLVDDLPTQLQEARAKSSLNQENAKQAWAEADALNAKMRNATTSLASTTAEIESSREKARLSRSEAAAKSQRSGLANLEQREKLAKQKLADLNSAQKRMGAVRTQGMGGTEVEAAICGKMQFPELIGCPKK